MKPKIGIFAQRRKYAGRLFNNLALDYVDALESVGGQVSIIPIFTKNLSEYIAECQGFLFPGGQDINPTLYGQPPSGARDISPEYDVFLVHAMQQVLATHKPLLGICKGMQLLNVAHGGTLKQDVEENTYHFQMERGYEKVDTLEIMDTDSFLGKLYKSGKLKVNSIHHQAVDRVGDGLRVVARSTFDHEVEAIEHIHLPYYGVQWHPEYFGSEKLFSYFLQQCQ